MDAQPHDYDSAIATVTQRVLAFLRVFEQTQQDIDFRHPASAQARLRAASASLFPALPSYLAAMPVPPQKQAAHAQLQLAANSWAQAALQFLDEDPAGFGLAFVNSRRLLCAGLLQAYAVREHFPLLQPLWVTDTALADIARLDARAPDVDVPVGVMHMPASAAHGEYGLYVPENYTPARRWPVVVALHGAYGHGHEYLWTWLRIAHSHGCVILAPKSFGPTWSLTKPAVDIDSIKGMLAALTTRYQIDAGRIYLSGLSDGGSFAYVFGLSCPSLIAGVAPIAAVLHPVADQLLRQKQGLEVPLFVVHGAQDFIFDVRAVRSQVALLEKLGYRVTYTELPHWGHAYTNNINEQLVWPWFAGLVSGS
jgi:dienelactone hydrolase